MFTRPISASTFCCHDHCTLGDYVRELRIQRARWYLADIERPLCETGASRGLQRLELFGDWRFKRYVGVTPSHFC